MPLPTPQQLDAMAREYSTVRPIEPCPPPDDLHALCQELAELAACTYPLAQAPSKNVAELATQAVAAIGQMQAQIAAMDKGAHTYDAPTPAARNYTELVRLALLASARLCRELYADNEGRSLAMQLPYLTSLAHYVGSLLLSITAF